MSDGKWGTKQTHNALVFLFSLFPQCICLPLNPSLIIDGHISEVIFPSIWLGHKSGDYCFIPWINTLCPIKMWKSLCVIIHTKLSHHVWCDESCIPKYLSFYSCNIKLVISTKIHDYLNLYWEEAFFREQCIDYVILRILAKQISEISPSIFHVFTLYQSRCFLTDMSYCLLL